MESFPIMPCLGILILYVIVGYAIASFSWEVCLQYIDAENGILID